MKLVGIAKAVKYLSHGKTIEDPHDFSEEGFFGIALNEVIHTVIYSLPYLICWTLGYVGSSPLWSVGIACIWLGTQYFSHRLKTNHYIIQQLMHLCSMEKLQQIKTSRRLQILKKFMDANLSVAKPEALLQPDFEQVEWFNSIIHQLWPYLCDIGKRVVFEDVKPDIEEQLSQFQIGIRSFEMGQRPPQLSGIKVYKNYNSSRSNEINIDLHISWFSDMVSQISIFNTLAEINTIQFSGLMRITCSNLLSDFPVVGGISMTFLRQPEFDFHLSGTTPIINQGLVQKAISASILAQFNKKFLIPNRIDYPLVEQFIMEVQFRMPSGVVRVFVLEGRNLKDMDMFGHSDPYVKVTVGAQERKTRFLYNTKEPIWWNNEKNDFIFDFLVHDIYHQSIKIDVFDKDADWDDHIGTVVIPIVDIYGAEAKSLVNWYKLTDDGGEVRLQMSFLTLNSCGRKARSTDITEEIPDSRPGTKRIGRPRQTIETVSDSYLRRPLYPNHYMLGIFLDTITNSEIVGTMKVTARLNITESIAEFEKISTHESERATGPVCNFAQTFFVYLQYAEHVKIDLSVIEIGNSNIFRQEFQDRVSISEQEFEQIFESDSWSIKLEKQLQNGSVATLNLCLRRLDGNLRCIEDKELESRKLGSLNHGWLIRLKKFAMRPTQGILPIKRTRKTTIIKKRKPLTRLYKSKRE